MYMSLGSNTGLSSPPLGMRKPTHFHLRQYNVVGIDAEQHPCCTIPCYCISCPVSSSHPPSALTRFEGYLRLDLETGKKQEWLAPMHTYCEEVVVVQKKINKKERKEREDEDDVWVLGSMFDAVKNKACVGIFDGRDISKGLP